MNIGSINNASFGAKAPVVSWARNLNNREYNVDSVLKNRIALIESDLIKEAKKCKAKRVVLAQTGDQLLVNSGAVTSLIRNAKSKSPDEILAEIVQNITRNKQASRGESLTNILA